MKKFRILPCMILAGILCWYILADIHLKWAISNYQSNLEVYDTCIYNARNASSLQEMVDQLVYVYTYYPNGTRGDKSSIAASLSEKSRKMACESIITHLEYRTGETLCISSLQNGNKERPNEILANQVQAWIQKYGSRNAQENFEAFRAYEMKDASK